MKHKWLGDICTVCGIQRKTTKLKNAKDESYYVASYFDKNGAPFAARPLCKLK